MAIILLATHSQAVLSQIKPSFRISFTDSLQIDKESYFLYPVFSLQHKEDSLLQFQLVLHPPRGWRMMNDSIISIDIPKDSLVRIPYTFIRQRGASSNWSSVKVQLRDNAGGLLKDTFLLLRAPLIQDFSLLAVRQDLEADESTTELPILLKIQNKGTRQGVYQFAIRNSTLRLKKDYQLRLDPGEDTTYSVTVIIPLTVGITSERLLLQVEDSSNNIRSLPINFHRVYRSLKVHSSKYQTVPTALELGGFWVDKQFFYFGDVRLGIPVRNGSLELSFRTKTFGPQRTIEKNILTVNFRNPRWDIALGQLVSTRHFYAYGRGAKLNYKPKNGVEFGIESILRVPSLVHTSNYFTASIRYANKKVDLFQKLMVDLDRRKGLNSYLFFQETKILLTKSTSFKFNFSFGWEEFLRIRLINNNDPGIGIGYSYSTQLRSWDFQSSWQYFQKSYPGIDKGSRIVNQLIRWRNKKHAIEVGYQYNSITSSILLDTIYYSDAYHFNMEKVGVKWSKGSEKSMLSLGTGLFRQTGLSVAQLPLYQYAELALSFRLSEKSKIFLSSLSGYANNSLIDHRIWMTNSSLDIQLKKGGIRGFFIQQPVLQDSIIKKFLRYNQSVLITPYANFKIWRQFNGMIRYTLSKSLVDKRTTSGLGFTLMYRSGKGNWQVSASGTFPFTPSTTPGLEGVSYPYFTFSLKKNIQLPFIFKRKHFNLTVKAFEDLNLNGKPEEGEPVLSGLRLGINQQKFLTDSLGDITIFNTDTGQYLIEVSGNNPAHRGLIPPEKNSITIEGDDKEIFLPFRKGRFVFGKVVITPDPYAGTKFTPDNILIRAIDSTGKKYSILTDSSGYYSLSLPAGRYTVSLNEEAFKGPIRPVQSSFSIDLSSHASSEVNFMLIQQRREIRMRK
jgi:hypothetical protein